ncbi:hypothetical protein CGZ75_11235 [Paenibacillus herberti]|uniref:DUF2500 domain-containing protein n=2 Tax=Paenibacillus herberti TaxID=1619309 RepID=A0A229P5P1_9BACL|nr:hypothetical protein CGZ75_11235 [Paenibacillus herberti]
MFNFVEKFGPIFIGLVFVLIIGTFVFVIGKGLLTWGRNNASPVITVPCRIADKRTEVWGGSGDSSANTSYFVTFEFGDGSRKEIPVPDNQYGLLVVGDQGELTYQGTRFQGFNRLAQPYSQGN